MEATSRSTSKAFWRLRYDHWNRTLCEYFFNPNNAAGRPVYMQVDADTLSEIGPSLNCPAEGAVSDFVQAVRSMLDANISEPFWRFKNIATSWREDISPHSDLPPFIALLGLCVLAASNMHADDRQQYSSANFYVHLNKLIGRNGREMPTGFDTLVSRLWSDLHTWLDDENHGRRGLATATAPTEGAGRYVSYPISQCLLRKVDRNRLSGFFTFSGISPGAVLDPRDLVQPLAHWCRQSTCDLSHRARHLFLQGIEERSLQAAAVVAAEALSWSGETRDDTGRHVAPIDMVVRTLRRATYRLEFYPRRPQGFPVGDFDCSLGTFHLEPSEDPKWYGPIQISPEEMLGRELELRSGGLVLRWAGSRTIALKPAEEDLGGHVSVRRAELDEQVLVVTRDALYLTRFLEKYAKVGWRRAEGVRGLPLGWHIFLDVCIQSQASVEAYPDLECLIPAFRTSISLAGGLKLDATTWLVGAEPVLHVAPPGDGTFDISVDSRPVLHAEGGGAELDLSTLGLAAGTHTVVVGDRLRNFQTMHSGDFMASRVLPEATPTLTHVLQRHGSQFEWTFPSPRRTTGAMPPAGELWVMGARIVAREADLPENSPQPVLLHGGAKRYVLLGPQPGMIFQCHDPAAPPTGMRLPLGMRCAFQVSPPFQVVWVISDFRRGRSVHLEHRLAPREGDPWPEGDVNAWSVWLTKSYRRPPAPAVVSLWRDYVEKAKALA